MLHLVSEELPLSVLLTHVKHAARIREESVHAPAVQMPELERQQAAKEKNAVPASTKTSTQTAVMAVAAAAAEVAAAEVAALETVSEAAATPVSIAAEKDLNAVAQSLPDARTISSSAQMLVAAAAAEPFIFIEL